MVVPKPVRLVVTLLGSFNLSHSGQTLTVSNRKAQALLAYLLLTSTLQDTRERLCGLLWSESPEEKARTSLRQVLYQLRRVFDSICFHGMQAEHERIVLDRAAFDVDIWAVTAQAEAGQVHPALLTMDRMSDGLLRGFEDIDMLFGNWLSVQRQALHERLERPLLAALSANAGDPGRVVSIARALLCLDATHEPACRALMRTEAERGDTGAALRAYKRLWDTLDAEYDIEPSDETQDLVVQIKTGAVPRHVSCPSPRLGPPDTAMPTAARTDRFNNLVMVAEFTCRGILAEHIGLVHALRHEVVSKLVRFRDWTVVDFLSPIHPLVEGSPATRSFVIEATVFPGGDRLIFTITLKDAQFGRYLWSDSFVLEVERWFAVQQMLIRKLAAALDIHISMDRLNAIAPRADVTLGVFDRSLRGMQLILEWTPTAWRRAHAIFQPMMDEVPRFALSYIGMVRLKNSEHLVLPGVHRSPAQTEASLVMAKLAVAADPFDSRAQHCLAWSYAMTGRFDQAEMGFGIALDLNENEPWVVISSGLGLAYCGQHARALTLADQALAMHPTPTASHWMYQAQIRLICGDDIGAASAADRAGTIARFLPAWHAAALAHSGRTAEAEACGQAFLAACKAEWCGPGPATGEAISSWVLRAFPFKRAADWDRLRAGMQRAGIPIDPACQTHCAIV